MTDATREGLISSNPVLRIRSGRRRRAGARIRSHSDPLTPSQIVAFLATVPGTYRDFVRRVVSPGLAVIRDGGAARPYPRLLPSDHHRRYGSPAPLRRHRGRAADGSAPGRLLVRPADLRAAGEA